MAQSIDDEASALVRANIVIYEHSMRWADEAWNDGNESDYEYYRQQASKAAQRIDMLRGLTDEAVR